MRHMTLAAASGIRELSARDLAANHALYTPYVHSVRASDLERIWQETWQQIMHSTPYVHSDLGHKEGDTLSFVRMSL
jgi:hypothetical protein